MISLALDLSLAALTLWVAWRALSHRDLFVGVVLYIIFGLLLSLVWVRLGAGDIALAEAAIGAGLTGALLLDAASRRSRRPRDGATAKPDPAPRRGVRVPLSQSAGIALLVSTLAGILTLVVAGIDGSPARGLTRDVTDRLAESGIVQPVTAVLVIFRGYDTLLEVGVLFLAALGMLASRRMRDLSPVARATKEDPVLDGLVRVLLPALVLTSAHLLLVGTHRPGGGFQAGAILAAALVLLLLAGHRSVSAIQGAWLRFALLSGFLTFLAVAAGPMLTGDRLLELPVVLSSRFILVVEAAIALATGVTLASLFAGARPLPSSGPGRNNAFPAATDEP